METENKNDSSATQGEEFFIVTEEVVDSFNKVMANTSPSLHNDKKINLCLNTDIYYIGYQSLKSNSSWCSSVGAKVSRGQIAEAVRDAESMYNAVSTPCDALCSNLMADLCNMPRLADKETEPKLELPFQLKDIYEPAKILLRNREGLVFVISSDGVYSIAPYISPRFDDNITHLQGVIESLSMSMGLIEQEKGGQA